jgi:hypothetical protein
MLCPSHSSGLPFDFVAASGMVLLVDRGSGAHFSASSSVGSGNLLPAPDSAAEEHYGICHDSENKDLSKSRLIGRQSGDLVQQSDSRVQRLAPLTKFLTE